MVLDEGMKIAIMKDVVGFFDAKDVYAEFEAPWKVSCCDLSAAAVVCVLK